MTSRLQRHNEVEYHGRALQACAPTMHMIFAIETAWGHSGRPKSYAKFLCALQTSLLVQHDLQHSLQRDSSACAMANARLLLT